MLIVPRAIFASVLKDIRRFGVSKRGRTVQYAGGGKIGSFRHGTGLSSSSTIILPVYLYQEYVLVTHAIVDLELCPLRFVTRNLDVREVLRGCGAGFWPPRRQSRSHLVA